MSDIAENVSMERIRQFSAHASPEEKAALQKVHRRHIPYHNASANWDDLDEHGCIKWEPLPGVMEQRRADSLAILEQFEARIAREGTAPGFNLSADSENPQ